MFGDRCHKKIRDGFKRNPFLNDPFAAIGLDLINRAYHHCAPNQEENMKNYTHLVIAALSVAMFALLAPSFVCSKRSRDVKGSGDSTTA
jgi:hypothetical protein